MRPRLTLEREVKLAIPPGFRVPKGLGELQPPKLFVSTYLDTTDYRLAAAGITLRRRLEQGRGLWQLKLPGDHGRWELELAGAAGSPSAVVLDLLYAHLRGATVQPIATLRTRRCCVLVRGGGEDSAQIVVDTVSVLERRRVQQSFRECEIELLAGDPAILSTIETNLRRAGASDHDGRPKLFRALGILHPESAAAVSGDASVQEQVKSVLGAQVCALLAQDPLVRLGTQPEPLHQMRVATRRLRAVLRALRPIAALEWVESLRTELDWLGGVLGPARDLDVQAAYFQGELNTLDAKDRRSVRSFIRTLRRERVQAQHELVSHLRSERYLGLLDELHRAHEEPRLTEAGPSLRDLAAAEFRRLRRFARSLSDRPTDAELHRLRIKAKRARYVAELAATAVGKPAWRFVDAVKELQDLLGSNQDAVVAEGRVRAFLERSPDVRAAFAAGRMVERQRQRRAQAVSSWQRAWKRVAKRGKQAWG